MGAVSARWERRWFVLLSSGELKWNAVDETDIQERSCLIVNAHISSSKSLIAEEIGEFDDTASPYYLLITTATRRLTVRTSSSAERDRWLAHLTTVASQPRDPGQFKLAENPEMVFALAPMQWNGSLFAQCVPRPAFRALCERYEILADASTVDSVFDGLVAEQNHPNPSVVFDRFLLYVKGLTKSLTEPSG
jgi:hypothetical protein